MFSGKPVQNRPERGVPASAKKQLVVLFLLLGAVTLLSFRLVHQLQQDSEPGEKLDEASRPLPGLGTPIAEFEDWKPMEPQPPEPFVENPEILFQAQAKDGTMEIDEGAAAYLFQKILTDSEAFRSEKPDLSLYEDDDVFHRLETHPDLYRGRIVKVKGIIVQPEGEAPLQLRGLEFPNPSGRDRFFQSYLYGTDDKYYLVATLNPRPDIGHRDGVRLRAYFCQLYKGDVLVGGRIRKATIPCLVGEDYEVIESTSSEAPDLTIFLVIAIPLMLVAFALIHVLNRRSRSSFEKRRRQAKLEVQGKPSAAGVETEDSQRKLED